VEQVYNIVLQHPVALCIPISVQLHPYIEFALQRLYFSSYLLFTTCFGLTGHHQVDKIVDENCCPVVMLLYFAFYE
jgi:hypothetical protein